MPNYQCNCSATELANKVNAPRFMQELQFGFHRYNSSFRPSESSDISGDWGKKLRARSLGTRRVTHLFQPELLGSAEQVELGWCASRVFKCRSKMSKSLAEGRVGAFQCHKREASFMHQQTLMALWKGNVRREQKLITLNWKTLYVYLPGDKPRSSGAYHSTESRSESFSIKVFCFFALLHVLQVLHKMLDFERSQVLASNIRQVWPTHRVFSDLFCPSEVAM